MIEMSGWKLFSMCLSSFSLGFSVCSLIVSLIRSRNLKMFEPERLFQELLEEHGAENEEAIMDSISRSVIAMIEFMANKANVSVDIMCQALAITYNQTHMENKEETT